MTEEAFEKLADMYVEGFRMLNREYGKPEMTEDRMIDLKYHWMDLHEDSMQDPRFEEKYNGHTPEKFRDEIQELITLTNEILRNVNPEATDRRMVITEPGEVSNFWIEIYEGHHGGGCFWIQPVRINHETKRVEECSKCEISIDEMDIHRYLRYFLMKHYVPATTAEYRYRCGEPELYVSETEWAECEFDWYSHNIYSYETVKTMLREMWEVIQAINNREPSKALNNILHHNDGKLFGIVLPKIEEKHWRKKQNNAINTLMNFYYRIYKYLNWMMEEASEYDAISFKGP